MYHSISMDDDMIGKVSVIDDVVESGSRLE